jgi:Dynamin family
MFKHVRRILTASGFGATLQANSASRSDAPISVESDNTGEHQPDRLVTGMEELTPDSEILRPVPRLALCGEFSAGKSSIVNLLLGCDMLPTAVLPSTHRPTFLRYAPDLRIEAVSEKGEREQIASDAIETMVREDISHFEIGMPNAALRDIEVLDTPGFADPFHDPARTLDVVESADICVWCTLATQAWRESERETWLSLPSKFRTSGILVVTHTDTLAHARDRERVRTRLRREAGNLFGDIVFLAVPDAMRARRDGGQVVDPEMWQKSGGNALVAALQKLAIDHFNVRGESARSGQATERTPARTEIAPTDSVAATTTPSRTRLTTSASEALVEPRAFLTRLAAMAPACLAAGWIDLTRREVLVLYGAEVTAETGSVSEAITELLQGAHVKRIETPFLRSHDLADRAHCLQEIFVVTDTCLGVFLRSESTPDRALVIISDKSIDLRMMIARVRRMMKSPDLII